MNGSPAAPVALPPANPQVVMLLEQALAMAKAGQIIGCGLISVVGPSKYASAAAGTGIFEIHLGAGVLMRQLEEQTIGKPSRILQVRG